MTFAYNVRPTEVGLEIGGVEVATLKSIGLAVPAATVAGDASQFGQVAMVKIASANASASAYIDFTGLNGSLYSRYILVISELGLTTAGQQLYMRISTGSGFIATGYKDGQTRVVDSGATGSAGSGSAGGWTIGFYIEMLSSGSYYSGEFFIGNPDSNNANKRMTYQATGHSSNLANMVTASGGGLVGTNSAPIDGITVFAGSGTIASGTFTLYGVRA